MKTLAAAVIVLGLAPSVGAQTPASPAPPSPAPPRVRNRFELSLRLQGNYDDNVLQARADGADEYFGEATAGLSYRHQWRRSSLDLQGQTSAQKYADFQELDRVGYGGRGILDLTLFRRTTLTFNSTYTSSYTRDTPALAAEGLVLPLVLTHRSESNLRLEHPFSPRWKLVLDNRFERVDFPSALLANGEELTLFPSLQRRLGRRYSVGLGYVFDQGWSGGQEERAHGVLAGVERRSPKGFGYKLFGGGAYLESIQKITGIGTAEVSFSRRKERVGARYERSVRHAFGLGRQVLSDLVSFNASRDLTRRVNVAASGTVAINTDPRDTDFRYRSDTYVGVIRCAVTRELSVGAGFSHVRSELNPESETPGNRGWFLLEYTLGL